MIFADSRALPEDYTSLHPNGGRGIHYAMAVAARQGFVRELGGQQGMRVIPMRLRLKLDA